MILQRKCLILIFAFVIGMMATFNIVFAQCSSVINQFPYAESFENDEGGWTSGGVKNDWEWGTPNKTYIRSAGEGTKCWIAGGLTGTTYLDGASSWVKSPCFDFTDLENPFIRFMVNWETEQQFDGASLQYSLNNGATWITLGASNETANCINAGWYNTGSINYLNVLTNARQGWSGNSKATSGSCRGGNGSGGWIQASRLVPELAGEPSVVFRFIFGTGTQCSNYDGFAFDYFYIGESPVNAADFDFNCSGENSLTIQFQNNSSLCPTSYEWNFGDPSSTNNTSTDPNPKHEFSKAGTYTVTLTVNGPYGLAPSSIQKQVNVISATAISIQSADCQTNTGGLAQVIIEGVANNIQIQWQTNPIQTNTTATQLAAGIYTVEVEAENVCTATATVEVPIDSNCSGIFFPSAFTPNGDGLNDEFGVIGALGTITHYKFKIYNRWGQLVFSTTDPFTKWKGDFNGKAVNADTYVWMAEIAIQNQEPVFYKGTLLLQR